MKQIGPSTQDFDWSSRLVSQLAFIRKNLRYPISKATVLPAFFIVASIPAVVFLIYSTAFKNQSAHPKPLWLILIMVTAFVLPSLVATCRYLQTLKFVIVMTGAGLPENMILLGRFLKEHHFAFARHPDAPEVFHIISKSLGGKAETREVVIFVADEKRILVNSHFTSSRFVPAITTPHYKVVARSLEKWIEAQRGQSGLRRF